VRGQVNHVLVEQAQNDSGVVLGTFFVNPIPATVLFDSGASHSFITDQFVTKYNLSMSSMKNPLIVSSPRGEMKTGSIYPQVKINIMGVDILANLVVLKSWGTDVILGMDWLQKHDGVSSVERSQCC
jgi:predicted aspartyl protease